MEGALFLNSENAQPVYEVGHVHHYLTFALSFFSFSPRGCRAGGETPHLGMTAGTPLRVFLLRVCGLWKWSSGSGMATSRCCSTLVSQPDVALRGATALDHPPLFPLPSFLSPITAELNRTGKSCHLQSKITVFAE